MAVMSLSVILEVQSRSDGRSPLHGGNVRLLVKVANVAMARGGCILYMPLQQSLYVLSHLVAFLYSILFAFLTLFRNEGEDLK